jgi:hypothetical protein
VNSEINPATLSFKHAGGSVDRPLRVAVCLSGAERLGSHALTLFARSLPTDTTVDCFCFFWEGGPLNEEAAIAAALGQKTEGRFESITVELGRNFASDLTIVVQKYPETNIVNVLRMFQGIRRCNDMKLRREVKDGIRYDVVIRTRADVQLSSEIELGRFLPIARDFIVFPENGHWRGGLNDQFAFSSSSNMDAYASVIDYLAEHCANGCVFHPETLLRYHLLKMGKYPVLAPISALVIRD